MRSIFSYRAHYLLKGWDWFKNLGNKLKIIVCFR